MSPKVMESTAGIETLRRQVNGDAGSTGSSRRRKSRLKLLGQEASLRGLQFLQHLSPKAAAQIADRIFFTPPRFEAPENERALLATGHRFTVPFKDGKLHAWSWPVEQAGPTILLVHGWGGRGGQLSPFVLPLLSAGFSVVLFDQPSHGLSRIPALKGQASMREFALAVDTVARHVGELGRGVAGIIGHSMGGSAAVFAASCGLKVEKLVTIGTPVAPFRYFDHFVKEVGLSRDTTILTRELAEARIGLRWYGLDLNRFLRTIETERAPELGPVKGLVVHDEDDRDTPFEDATTIARAWKGSELYVTKGLGHRRILKDAEVIERVTQFLRS